MIGQIFTEHTYQFIITLVIVLSYVITNLNGKSTSLLENVVLLAVSFWFISSTNRVSTNQINDKVDSLAAKVDTQEVNKTKV